MKIYLIRIGNSLGIRLPKAVIEQCRFKDEIDAEIVDGKLILTVPQKTRTGWEDAFKKMAQRGDDVLLDQDDKLASDVEDWKW